MSGGARRGPLARVRARLRRRTARGVAWSSLVVSAALLGSMLVSIAAAWGVRQSWLQHRASVDATLDEYAHYAARSFADQLIGGASFLRWRALAPALGAGAAPSLAAYAAAAAPALDAEGLAGDSLRGFLRLDPRDGGWQTVGVLADSAVAAAARAGALRTLARGSGAGVPVAFVLPSRRGPLYVVVARRAPAADGGLGAVYGFAASRLHVQRALAGQAQRPLLLPPGLLAPGWRWGSEIAGADTLVAIRVVDHAWGEIYRTPWQYASPAEAEFRYTAFLADYTIHASLHPTLAARLRAGFLQDDRRRLQVVLPVVAVLLAAAATLHLRRERELARARRDFVASVSHELRTPLAQIRMFSETLLLDRADDEAERRRWLGVIGREARRLGDLVENILLFSHIDAARMRLEPERTDLGELVEEAVEAYVAIAAARRMRIVADAPSRIYALVDPRALRQVVVNLLDNALKYGPPEQTVRVELERDGAAARLTVADEGPGVPVADRRRLFDPFVRLAAPGATGGGSGIGLSVVRSLVEQHGGSVVVEGADGGGARFVVTLPLAAAAAEPPRPMATAAG